jgi:hypothetical protein
MLSQHILSVYYSTVSLYPCSAQIRYHALHTKTCLYDKHAFFTDNTTTAIFLDYMFS